MKTICVIAVIVSVASAASLNNRIVGGQIAEDGQFPYEVSLRDFEKHICGGSIINEEWILTAAHCVVDHPEFLMTVVTGTNSLNDGGDIYKVLKKIYHKDYATDKDTAINDIAIIKLKTKIVFNEKVQPIPLNTEEIPSGSGLVISGWGYESWPSDKPSNVLKYLKVKAVGTKECQDSFKKLKKLRYDVNDAQLCAFARDGEGACSGDSGSPLVYNGKVAGIASWVEPCGVGYPDVYTKVSKYVEWIDLKMRLEG